VNRKDAPLYLPILLAAAISILPIIYLIYGSVWNSSPGLPGHLTLANYANLAKDPSAGGVLANTVEYSVGAALFSITLAFLLAILVQRTDAPFRRFANFSLLIVLALPWMIEDISWTYLLSPRIGLYNLAISRVTGLDPTVLNVYSIWGMIWVMGLSLTPLAYLIISSSLRGIDSRLEEVSSISGAGVRTTILRIDLPLVLPSILSAFLLSFVIANEAFDTAAIIGIPGRVFVLTSSIYYDVEGIFPPNYGAASAYAIILVAITLLAIYLYSRTTVLSQRFQTVRGNIGSAKLLRLGRWRWLGGAIVLVYFFGYPVPVIATLVFASLHSFWNPLQLPPISLQNYAAFLDYPSVAQGALNSTIVAFTTVGATLFLAFFVGYFAARRRGVLGRLGELATSLPLGFPTIVLGVGLLWALVGSPIPIYGTVWALALAYTIRYVPIITRFLSGPLTQIHVGLEEMSRICGAGTATTLREIIYPLLKPALLSAGVYLFIVSIKDLGAAVILVSPGSVLISAAIFDLWYSGGSNVLVATAGGVIFVAALSLVLAFVTGVLKLSPVQVLEAERKWETVVPAPKR
jgi:iron(III) transport system permease protein